MGSVRAARFRGREISLLQGDPPPPQGSRRRGEKEREGLGKGSRGRDDRQRVWGRNILILLSQIRLVKLSGLDQCSKY